MILPKDIQRCTGVTSDGHPCHMKQNCKRYLAYGLDDEVYIPVNNAPECIKFTPLQCPLKITAHDENQKNNN